MLLSPAKPSEVHTVKTGVVMLSIWLVRLVQQTKLYQDKLKLQIRVIKSRPLPELLEVLSLLGCLVTIDVMECPKDIAEKIVVQGPDADRW